MLFVCFVFLLYFRLPKENFELQWKSSEISRYKLLQKIACRGTTKATESNQGPNGAEWECWTGWDAKRFPRLLQDEQFELDMVRGHSKGKFYYSFSHHFSLHFLRNNESQLLILNGHREDKHQAKMLPVSQPSVVVKAGVLSQCAFESWYWIC